MSEPPKYRTYEYTRWSSSGDEWHHLCISAGLVYVDGELVASPGAPGYRTYLRRRLTEALAWRGAGVDRAVDELMEAIERAVADGPA